MGEIAAKYKGGVGFKNGGMYSFTQTTILIGKGENITNINYNNITINPLVFEYPLKKNYKMSIVVYH